MLPVLIDTAGICDDYLTTILRGFARHGSITSHDLMAQVRILCAVTHSNSMMESLW